MFYLFFSLSFLLLMPFILKKNKNINKILKILVIIYCIIIFIVTITLPDAYVRCFDNNELTHSLKDIIYALVRWFNALNFVILPIAVFYNNQIIRKIAKYFSLPMIIISIICYPIHLQNYTSTLGRGLNSIDILSASFKKFLINPIFRSIIQGIIWLLELSIIIMLSKENKIKINIKEIPKYLVILIFLLISSIPIYIPQHLFGYSNIIFDKWTLPHLLWILFIIIEILALNKIFKNKPKEIKKILCLILSLSLFLQYNQMFGAISMSIKRLPFQLCNIGAYLILLSLITENKRIFNFTLIVNVIGVLFALFLPDLDGEGLFYLYNMHFIFEHTNVLVVPLLALSLKLFPKLDQKALKDCLLGFTIYFVFVLIIGTLFNAIALKTNNSFYEANYLFMFNQTVATNFIESLGKLFNNQIKIGKYIVLYPVIQLVVYITFIVLCTILYYIIRLIYIIKDKKSNICKDQIC